MHALTRALWRYGGVVVQPRATTEALREDEGAYDGVLLGLLYVLCVGTLEILGGVATARVTADLGGVLMLLGALGRVVVVPIVVLVACETVLGRGRAHRRGLMLVPLLATMGLTHELAVHGLTLPSYGPEIVGGILCVALSFWVRGSIAPQREDAA